MILSELFYELINWKNRPSTATALGATNLNHMDQGILECVKKIIQLSQEKAELATVNGMVKDWTLDLDSWVVTVTKQDGTISTFDLPIEQVVVNFTITDDNVLVLTLEDGSQKLVDISRFVYSFDSTATIAMSMTDRHVTASIVKGSITMEMLESSIQSTFQQYTLDAEAAAINSRTYSQDSKRYAVGGVVEGDGEDNAKYYCEQAQNAAAIAQEVSTINYPAVSIDTDTGHLESVGGKGLELTLDSSGHLNSTITV